MNDLNTATKKENTCRVFNNSRLDEDDNYSKLLGNNLDIFLKFSIEEILYGDQVQTYRDQVQVTYLNRALEELRQKIEDCFYTYQEENWDYYGAEPMKYLKESLEFANSLSNESIKFVEEVEIVPENDGSMCFEWYKTETKYIMISVENDQLVYNYKNENTNGCGETSLNFSKHSELFNMLKKVVFS